MRAVDTLFKLNTGGKLNSTMSQSPPLYVLLPYLAKLSLIISHNISIKLHTSVWLIRLWSKHRFQWHKYSEILEKMAFSLKVNCEDDRGK